MTTEDSSFRDVLICIAEDRESERDALEILVASIARHLGQVAVELRFPPADEAFRRWLVRYPQVVLITEPLREASGWNIKPTVLLKAMSSRSFRSYIWLDSDIVVNSPFLSSQPFVNLGPLDLVACEETYFGQNQGGTHRTESWGFSTGRSLHTTINTGVIRVTAEHSDLLKEWQRMLQRPEYLLVQQKPSLERPIHMLGDQEAFTGLLGSVDFSDIPIRFLKRGEHIVQEFGAGGFTPAERIKAIRGHPPFLVHAMGRKPWHIRHTPKLRDGLREYYDALAAELSTYRYVAKNYVEEIESREYDWICRGSTVGRILSALSHHNPWMSGFVLSLIDYAVRYFKAILGIDRYHVSSK